MPDKFTMSMRCPECGDSIDSALYVKDDDERKAPRPGDIGVCMQCGAISAVTKDLTLRTLTEEEADAARHIRTVRDVLAIRHRMLYARRMRASAAHN